MECWNASSKNLVQTKKSVKLNICSHKTRMLKDLWLNGKKKRERDHLLTGSFRIKWSDCLIDFQSNRPMHYSLYTCLNLIFGLHDNNIIKAFSLDNRMQLILHIFPTESVLVVHFCAEICSLGLPPVVHSIFYFF